jgi:hypothetical protein
MSPREPVHKPFLAKIGQRAAKFAVLRCSIQAEANDTGVKFVWRFNNAQSAVQEEDHSPDARLSRFAADFIRRKGWFHDPTQVAACGIPIADRPLQLRRIK